jgi:subtilisin family serine protease
VAGTIGGARYGVAKGVKLVAVRVLDCEGSGYVSDVIKGVQFVTAHAVKPAVANMSLGGDISPALDKAVARSIASGVTYTLAAGNEGANACGSSPARVPAAITVGAINASDTRASFSNFGSCVDIFAPGVGVTSDYPDYQIDTMSGTSMASPHVAGAAAMLLAATPALTPAQVAYRLVANSTKNHVRNAGKKSPNRELFTPAAPTAAHITTTALPDATAGQAYSTTLRRSVSLTGIWTASGLPTGLTMSRAGVLSGTVATPGDYPITVKWTDFVPRAASTTLTLTVS